MLSSVELQCLQVYINEVNSIKAALLSALVTNKETLDELYAARSYLEKRIETIQSHRITGE